ncbi:glycosyl hydrolase family 18 protein [Acetivibrio mesophilus]|uniref:chitinase n=1 Tax=Acetivibrio mesophilus TaxID=2487273 RepID=A0A4Q0I5H2_9FIRM|nr:glycosyl hydrolase family 18 protein [Acetivibrio mesophilus]ODM25885.1 glycoside hydrolase [Clostridium sp. Bc-iso-3]RXE59531.1 glycoside hydrolase [Acetivibrio mesophilus]HHV30008.1 glycoside hydrolase [Clostridium sp.]
MKKKLTLLILSIIVFISSYTGASYAENASLPSKRIVGYFAEWNIYIENNYYEVSDIPWDKITHINYAFAKIENGKIAIIDKWAAIQKPFGDDTWDTPIKGHFGQLIKYKKQFPNVKTLISVGGWTESKYFSDVALTEESRTIFADSCVEFIRTYQFDGVDIDWEYPVSGGVATNIRRPEDKQNFTLLLKCLREKLDAAGEEDGKSYLLTIAAPAGSYNIKNTEPELYHKYLDFINVMTYDYSGSWEDVANHLSPLYMNPNDPSYPERKEKFNVDWTIKEYLRHGIPADKINMGVPYYAAGWEEISGGVSGLFGTSSKTLNSTQFHYINGLLQAADSGFVRYWDEDAMVPYLWNPATATFYSYDDEVSLKNKCNYVMDNNLGGIMIWELSGDYPEGGGNTLTSVIYDSFVTAKNEMYGDVNGDGKVNSTDLMFLKRYMLRVISDFPYPGGKRLADLNGDDNINSTDYTILKRYILKTIDSIPIN